MSERASANPAEVIAINMIHRSLGEGEICCGHRIGMDDATKIIKSLDAAGYEIVRKATPIATSELLRVLEASLGQQRAWAADCGVDLQTDQAFGAELYRQCRAIYNRASGITS